MDALVEEVTTILCTTIFLSKPAEQQLHEIQAQRRRP